MIDQSYVGQIELNAPNDVRRFIPVSYSAGEGLTASKRFLELNEKAKEKGAKLTIFHAVCTNLVPKPCPGIRDYQNQPGTLANRVALPPAQTQVQFQLGLLKPR